MAENVYEGMFILDPGRYSRDPEGVSGQVTQLIEQIGGEVLVSRLWEERRLAYPIGGQRKGTYWLTYFRGDGRRLPELKRACHVNDNFLRFLLLKVEPRLVDILVEHAKTGQVLTVSERAESASEARAERAGAAGDDEDQPESVAQTEAE